MDDENFDGKVTWDEAIANTDGMKVIVLERPVIRKEPGAVKIGDIPARDTIAGDENSMKKKGAVLGVHLGL